MPDDRASLPAVQNRLIDDLKTLLAAGDTYTAVSLALRARFHPDFQAVYLEGTDTVAHLFMRYVPPLMPGVTREDAQRFGHAVDEYYRHADDLVGRRVEVAGPQTAVIVCSDLRFRTGENRPRTDSRIGYGQAADWHRKYGIIVLAGPPFRKGHEVSEASVLDITPTVLALLGLPVGEDMEGRPILDAFEPSFLASHPVRYVRTYEASALASSAGATGDGSAARSKADPDRLDPQGDQELKEKLQSLGYLRQDTANSHNNRGMLLLGQGNFDDAIAKFEQAIQVSEDLPMARINIARALFKKKDYERATKVLHDYLRRQPRSKDADNLLGNIAMERKEYAEAEKRFRTALEYEPNFTDARNSLGILYNKLGRRDDALKEFLKVIAVDPEYAEALNNIGVIYKEQGKAQEAIASFRKAMTADPEFAGSFSNMALALVKQGKTEEGEGELKKALVIDPRYAPAYLNLARSLLGHGRTSEVVDVLTTGTRLLPGDPDLQGLLGETYLRLGQKERAIAAFEASLRLKPDQAELRRRLRALGAGAKPGGASPDPAAPGKP